MKKYRSSIILFLVFEAIAIWLWLSTGNLLQRYRHVNLLALRSQQRYLPHVIIGVSTDKLPCLIVDGCHGALPFVSCLNVVSPTVVFREGLAPPSLHLCPWLWSIRPEGMVSRKT